MSVLQEDGRIVVLTSVQSNHGTRLDPLKGDVFPDSLLYGE